MKIKEGSLVTPTVKGKGRRYSFTEDQWLFCIFKPKDIGIISKLNTWDWEAESYTHRIEFVKKNQIWEIWVKPENLKLYQNTED